MALADSAPIDLESLLAGAAPANAAPESRESLVPLRQARESVAELGELHLEFAVSGARALGEDVENQLRAIDHPQLETLAEVARLDGGEVC